MNNKTKRWLGYWGLWVVIAVWVVHDGVVAWRTDRALKATE